MAIHSLHSMIAMITVVFLFFIPILTTALPGLNIGGVTAHTASSPEIPDNVERRNDDKMTVFSDGLRGVFGPENKPLSFYNLTEAELDNYHDLDVSQFMPPPHSLYPATAESDLSDNTFVKRQVEETAAYNLTCTTGLGDARREGAMKCLEFIRARLNENWNPHAEKNDWQTVCRSIGRDDREIFLLEVWASNCHGPVTGADIAWLPEKLMELCGTCGEPDCVLGGHYRSKEKYPVWVKISASNEYVPDDMIFQSNPVSSEMKALEARNTC